MSLGKGEKKNTFVARLYLEIEISTEYFKILKAKKQSSVYMRHSCLLTEMEVFTCGERESMGRGVGRDKKGTKYGSMKHLGKFCMFARTIFS